MSYNFSLSLLSCDSGLVRPMGRLFSSLSIEGNLMGKNREKKSGTLNIQHEYRRFST